MESTSWEPASHLTLELLRWVFLVIKFVQHSVLRPLKCAVTFKALRLTPLCFLCQRQFHTCDFFLAVRLFVSGSNEW